MFLKAYTMPVLVSLAVHALVFALVFANWEATSKPRDAQRPRAVQAKIVEFTPTSQRQAEQQAAQQKIIDMRRQQAERERQEAERQRQQEARRQQAEREQREQAEREQREERQRQQEAERQRREQEAAEQRRREQEAEQQRQAQQRLDQALAEEAEFFEAQQAQQVAQSYVDVISQRIEQNWSRPPSARLGMQCVLEIQLVPTGQVVNVTVVESSGNSAFDRSAEQAVKRIDRFEEVQDMPSQVFERHFRQLRLVFKPEDLRQ